MYNYHKQLYTALSALLPAHYEMAMTSGATFPCLSYMEITNYDTAAGDTMGYSSLSYQVTVWAKTLAELQTYAAQVDAKLRPLGFTRTSAAELYNNESGIMRKVLTYDANAVETY